MNVTTKRYHILDEIRGITLCSMILYHAVWDLVYMFGYDWNWYQSDFAYLWQQSICWCFILLSGFCFSLGKRKWRRGLIVFGAGTLVTLVTHLFMPEQKVRFGVLTMLGVSMLLMALLEKIIELLFGDKKWNRAWKYMGLGVSMLLFFLMREINNHHLGFEDFRLYRLPDSLYLRSDFMTFLGFTRSGFYSTDYFSLMPWFFLFAVGYFLYQIAKEMGWLVKVLTTEQTFTKQERMFTFRNLFSFMGKHSLIIYMLHQPMIYGFLFMLEMILLHNYPVY